MESSSGTSTLGVVENMKDLLNHFGYVEGTDYVVNDMLQMQDYSGFSMSEGDYNTATANCGTPECYCEQSIYWAHQQEDASCDEIYVMYWYHPDYLGNTEFITDRSGDRYQNFFYTPWGESLVSQHSASASYSSAYRFNAKEYDAETGNYYYGARYYGPKASVWLSVDPLAHKYPSLSPYNFVANNPIMLIDPNGESIDFSYLQKWDEHFGTQITNKIVSSLTSLTGLSLEIDRDGMLQYERDDHGNAVVHEPKSSSEARSKLIAAIENPEVLYVYTGGSESFYDKQNGNMYINISESQVEGFISNVSEGLADQTLGFGMTFLHELGHSPLGGSLKDLDAFGDNGPNVESMNTIRRQMHEAIGGEAWGHRYYQRYPNEFTGKMYMPFSKMDRDLVRDRNMAPFWLYIEGYLE